MQCFSAFLGSRNVWYCAFAYAHCKNYNLRTAQKTITNLSSYIFQHVRNSLEGEAKVITPAQTYNVDGFHAESNTVYEYQGCFHHGCIKCFPNHRQKKRNCHPDRTVEEVYEATQTAILRDAGYTVTEKWGCEFANDKKTDPELQAFLERFELIPPLEPRDAFFGGRTGAATLYVKAENGEEISYQDYTFLYPWVNKYGTYPVGFPETYFNHEEPQAVKFLSRNLIS